MAKSYRKITLQSGKVKFFRADIFEEGQNGMAKYYDSIPDGEILLESRADFDGRLDTLDDNQPVTRNESRRNNGAARSVVTESNPDLAREVEKLCRSYSMTKPEALLMLRGNSRVEIHGLSESQVRESWSRFSEILTESEIDGLVKNRVAAPRK